jgi:hypothetical protein
VFKKILIANRGARAQRGGTLMCVAHVSVHHITPRAQPASAIEP